MLVAVMSLRCDTTLKRVALSKSLIHVWAPQEQRIQHDKVVEAPMLFHPERWSLRNTRSGIAYVANSYHVWHQPKHI